MKFDLTNIHTIQFLLSKYKLIPQKRFGQIFLIDETVVETMLKTADLQQEDTVIEIGPGIGALTTQIAPKVKKLIAVEFDRNMVKILKNNKTLEHESKITIINEDILNFNPSNYPLQTSHFKLIGSIPYQITSPLIHKLISWKEKPSVAVLLIQKEVAEKICGQPPKASYLSIFVSAFGKPETIKIIRARSFYPPPNVHSAIIKITFNEKSMGINPELFSKFLHHGFKNPRKMINKAFSKETLINCGVNPTLRPENLTLGEWLKLYESH